MKIDPSIHNITVSGRIGCGTTTLAKGLQKELNWHFFEGGELFEKFFNSQERNDTNRPDDFDLQYEEKVKKMLTDNNHQIIQSHLAGFDAQGVPGVFKIVVLCENDKGEDVPTERAKRIVQRRKISKKEALKEIKNREAGNLKKWRRLYADNDPNWVYWNKKYFDLVINTYDLGPQQALQKTLSTLRLTGLEQAS